MEKPWFQNRKCLDIGCNEGVITLGLAMRFGTASMLGVDIDQALIAKASRYSRSRNSFWIETFAMMRPSKPRRGFKSCKADMSG